MGIFIGGDTQEVEYDFGLKVSNSVAECPMKIYKGEIDPSSPPSPTTTYTNNVSNGDFSNGATGWSGVAGTLSVSNNVLSVTGDGTSQYVRATQTTTLTCVSGHNIYTRANIKLTNAVSTLLGISIDGSTAGNELTVNAKGSPIENGTNYLISGISTLTNQTGSIFLRLNHFYADASTANGKVAQIQQVQVVDLTALFGAGNEPTQTWCDTYLPFVVSTGTCPTGWTEITSQTVLDKLKTQNELTVSAIATDKSTVTWNGKTLPKTTTLKVVDDFVGKTIGNTIVNPHISGVSIGSSLLAPNIFTEVGLQSRYDNIATLNATTNSFSSTTAGQQPQQLFSFNIIEQFERKFGAIPKETTAEKVAWLKSNLSGLTFNVYVYGNSPLGNKAYIDSWSVDVSDWSFKRSGISNTFSNTSNSPTKLEYSTTSLQYKIGSDGFVHFLAYTDSARTTDSTLLVLTGHGLSAYGIIENTTRGVVSIVPTVTANALVTSTITGQTSGDIIKKYNYSATKNAETGTDTTTIKITNHGLSTGDFIKNKTRGDAISKITVVDANTITCQTAITGQVSGDVIYLYPLLGAQTAESTIVSSTIFTDYVSLELTLKAPENLITATNTLSDIVTDYTGKVSGSLTENANGARRTAQSSLITPSFNEDLQAGYDGFKTLNGTCSNANTTVSGYIPQTLFSFNIVAVVEKQLGQSIPAVDKVQWCKDNLYSITGSWYGYGSCPSGNKASLAIYKDSTSSWVVANTTTSSSVANLNITNNVEIPTRIDSNGVIHFLAYTDPSDGVTASTIYTDYVKLTIKLKYIPTYDFYTDSNTRRDAGLTDIVLVKRQIGDMTSDFTGKVSGSVVENPNVVKWVQGATSLIPPSGFSTENVTSRYTDISSLNGVCSSNSIMANGQYALQLFQFNLIEIAQRALGTSIPGADTASKVQWLKDNLAIVKCDWYGYGSCPSGNKAKLTTYNVSTLAWSTITTDNDASTPTLSTKYISSSFENYIDSDGFVNFLAYTDATDGVTPSVINTDYIKLTLTFKSDTVGYEYFTNNSAEVSVTTNNKASAYLIECDLTPIATALYGGSNAALKNALKRITADVYAMGSGANVNSLGNNVVTTMWSGDSSLYGYIAGWSQGVTWNKNILSSINKINFSTSTTSSTVPTTTNKIYILIYSTYKSDGAIASEVNLDYVNIKINLQRTNDVVTAIPITL